MSYEGSEGDTIRLHKENTVERECLLSRRGMKGAGKEQKNGQKKKYSGE